MLRKFEEITGDSFEISVEIILDCTLVIVKSNLEKYCWPLEYGLAQC